MSITNDRMLIYMTRKNTVTNVLFENFLNCSKMFRSYYPVKFIRIKMNLTVTCSRKFTTASVDNVYDK